MCGGERSETNGESGISIRTLLCVKWTAGEKLLNKETSER